jgi:hypothetical protein
VLEQLDAWVVFRIALGRRLEDLVRTDVVAVLAELGHDRLQLRAGLPVVDGSAEPLELV